MGMGIYITSISVCLPVLFFTFAFVSPRFDSSDNEDWYVIMGRVGHVHPKKVTARLEGLGSR